MKEALQQLLNRLNKSLAETDLVEITDRLEPHILGIQVFASRQVFDLYLGWGTTELTSANAKAIAANVAPLATQRRSGDFLFQATLESGNNESVILYSYCKADGTILLVSI